MRALDRKLLRDLLRTGPQLGAIALVLASGAGLFLAMRSTMRALEEARATYYARERFGDVFASLVRAPEHVADELRAIDDVERVQTRVVADVLLDVPGMTEAATGRLVSLPDRAAPEVGALRMRSGRRPQQPQEAVAHEAFAEAHGLLPGDHVTALIDGRSTPLEIVGLALAPEFTWTAGPGQILPDDRRFGVLWMGREALAEAFDMDGAFNDLQMQLGRGAQVERVIAQVDELLERYGGVGAHAREDQTSEAFVRNELDQLRTFGMIVPSMFLAVAAFLLNVVLGRVVAGQREQIAALKALGYRDVDVGLHYAKLIAVVCAAGLALGIALAFWLGTLMCELYGDYYRFPDLRFSIPSGELGWTVGAVAVAAAAGSAAAIRHTIVLPPAEAMRPPAPAAYHTTFVERLGLARLVPPAARIVLREIERRPGRALMSMTGIALATAMIVVTTFAYGAIDRALNLQFGLQQREDLSLAFVEPRAIAATSELGHLPGVLHAEPFRTVPVRLRHGSRSDDVAVIGMPDGGTLLNVLDERLRDLRPPPDGIVLTRKLAENLRLRAGDLVRIELREGERRVATAPVARVAETFVGLSAWMDLDALCRLLRETPTMNGALLLVDDARLAELHAELKTLPLVAGVAERRRAIESFETMIDENLGVSLAVNLSFALVMAFGVLYNAARITLAERSRDLASLRVLGFRRREVAAILLGELAALTATAIPIGLLLGWLGARAIMASLDTDQLRLPFVVRPWTYALAVVVVVAAAAVAGHRAWRRLDAIDLVEVLKARD